MKLETAIEIEKDSNNYECKYCGELMHCKGYIGFLLWMVCKPCGLEIGLDKDYNEIDV